MTGHQPTPALPRFTCSGEGKTVTIEEAVRACGVEFLKTGDPYDYPEFLELVKEAASFAGGCGGPAVVVSRHPCLMDRHRDKTETPTAKFQVTDDCTGCGVCQEDFGCPALVEGEDGLMKILEYACYGCGVCVHVCPTGAIEEVLS